MRTKPGSKCLTPEQLYPVSREAVCFISSSFSSKSHFKAFTDPFFMSGFRNNDSPSLHIPPQDDLSDSFVICRCDFLQHFIFKRIVFSYAKRCPCFRDDIAVFRVFSYRIMLVKASFFVSGSPSFSFCCRIALIMKAMLRARFRMVCTPSSSL